MDPLTQLFSVFRPLAESYGDTTDKPLLDCCACGTAKYRVTFYGNWSEKTHPKDYPRKLRPMCAVKEPQKPAFQFL